MKRATLTTADIQFCDYISIHTLCEEGDRPNIAIICYNFKFQSTPSVKRATFTNAKDYVSANEISIHTLCEEGDGQAYDNFTIPKEISIHTLCEEGDGGKGNGKTYSVIEFQSTPSVKRATIKRC